MSRPIRDAAREAGVSLTELAHLVNTSLPVMSRVVNGRQFCSLERLHAIARELRGWLDVAAVVEWWDAELLTRRGKASTLGPSRAGRVNWSPEDAVRLVAWRRRGYQADEAARSLAEARRAMGGNATVPSRLDGLTVADVAACMALGEAPADHASMQARVRTRLAELEREHLRSSAAA